MGDTAARRRGGPHALTIDVEDYFHVQAFARTIDRSSWPEREYRVEKNTHVLLDLFARAGARATFFVLGWVAQRSPQLVRDIQAAGHEVASHGMSHRLIFEQTPEEFRNETQQSKRLLEDLTGSEVIGYRAATYSITAKSLWALDILAECGYVYDSSIFPIRHDTYGIPDAPDRPGELRTPKGHVITEFPLSTVSFAGVKLPVAGGGYFRLLPFWLTRWGLRKLDSSGVPFTFYLHPWEVDPGQPRIGNAPWLARFRHYTNLDATLSRLTTLLQEFDFAPMRSVLESRGMLRDRVVDDRSLQQQVLPA